MKMRRFQKIREGRVIEGFSGQDTGGGLSEQEIGEGFSGQKIRGGLSEQDIGEGFNRYELGEGSIK